MSIYTEIENLREELDAVCVKHGYPSLNSFLHYRTSEKIPFATDNWGSEKKTHFELHTHGRVLQITIEPDHINMNGFFTAEQTAVNAIELRPR